MSYVYVVAKSYNTRADFLSDLWTQLSNMGWTLHDDQPGSSYKVYKSNGEASDRIYEYVKIDWITANAIQVRAYAWWNNSTHVGSSGAYSNGSLTTAETGFTGWIYGNMNLVILMTKVSTTYYRTGFGHFNKKFLTVETDLTANASSGTNVTITVTSTTGFLAGSYYQILGSQGEGRDKVQISSITDSTHMVIANLPRNYGTGARIGQSPSTFGYWNGANMLFQTCELAVVGTNTCSASGYYALDVVSGGLLLRTFVDPNARDSDFHYLQPLIGYEYNGVAFTAYNDEYIMQAPLGATEDVFYTNPLDSGTATSGDSTTLTDSTKSWATNAWANKVVVIIAGTGVGQTRKITSNTATALTVPTWVTNPDSTSQYVICDEAYRCLYNGIPYVVARESC
jgi:hypothetical protein